MFGVLGGVTAEEVGDPAMRWAAGHWGWTLSAKEMGSKVTRGRTGRGRGRGPAWGRDGLPIGRLKVSQWVVGTGDDGQANEGEGLEGGRGGGGLITEEVGENAKETRIKGGKEALKPV